MGFISITQVCYRWNETLKATRFLKEVFSLKWLRGKRAFVFSGWGWEERDRLYGACQREGNFLCPSMDCCRGSGGKREKGGCIAAGPQAHGAVLRNAFIIFFPSKIYSRKKSHKEDFNGWRSMGVFLHLICVADLRISSTWESICAEIWRKKKYIETQNVK